MRAPNWTLKRLDAAISACASILAGEEGEGDCALVKHDDLQAALERLKYERDKRLKYERDKRANVEAYVSARMARKP